MASTTLLPGFGGFHPSNVELISFYLKRKVTGVLPAEAERVISELNILHYSPWELPGESSLKNNSLEWYFFCPRERKYASGSRTKRATNTGFWKATGNDRPVKYNGRTVGMIKTLIFYEGHPPRGKRTDWVIHEYRMEDKHLADAGIVQDAYVLCKVFEKSGPGPKKAPFREEDWEDEEQFTEPYLSGVSPPMLALTDHQSCPVATSMVDQDGTSSFTLVEPGPSFANTGGVPPDDDINALLLPFFTEDTGSQQIENNNENISSLNQARSVEIGQGNGGDDIYDGLGNLDNLAELGEGRFNFCGNWAVEHFGLIDPVIPLNDNTDTAYLELNDLEMPLYDSNCDRETQHLMTDNLYSSYNSLIDVEESHLGGNISGGNQYVPGSSELPVPPDEYIEKVNGVDFDTNMGYNSTDNSWPNYMQSR